MKNVSSSKYELGNVHLIGLGGIVEKKALTSRFPWWKMDEFDALKVEVETPSGRVASTKIKWLLSRGRS